MKRIQGFTLAEVLITLAIIGVVAAMTIPILMQNYQKSQYITALKKIYSQISNAVDKAMLDENADNFNDVTLLNGSTADSKAFFKKYFRVSKYCDSTDFASCFPTVTTIDKNATGNAANGFQSCAILKDGASICAYIDPSGLYPLSFMVDTNGLDKPNIAGRDVFSFSVYYDGSVDEISPEDRDSNNLRIVNRVSNCVENIYGGGCFRKIFDAGWKMDY